jgi:hypothetical protein
MTKTDQLVAITKRIRFALDVLTDPAPDPASNPTVPHHNGHPVLVHRNLGLTKYEDTGRWYKLVRKFQLTVLLHI